MGKEEEGIHKRKNAGAVYKLNQTLISEIIADDSIKIKSEYIEEICHNPNNLHPSVYLLQLLLTKKEDIFIFSKKIDAKNILSKISVENITNNAKGIFLEYLGFLQSSAPTSDCLTKNIPYLSEIIINYRYLEEDVPSDYVMIDPNKVNSIFQKFSNIESIFQKCLKEKKLRTK